MLFFIYVVTGNTGYPSVKEYDSAVSYIEPVFINTGLAGLYREKFHHSAGIGAFGRADASIVATHAVAGNVIGLYLFSRSVMGESNET